MDLSGLSEEKRSYIFRNLPTHLDAVGKNKVAIKRLIELAKDDFIQEKIRWTNDFVTIDHDYKLFFKACLQDNDLASTIQIAKRHAGVSNLSRWLTSESMIPLLTHIPTASPYWTEIKRAIETIPSSKRIAVLTNFCQPGLPEHFSAWLRNQFDDIELVSDERLQYEFLVSIVNNQKNTTAFVFDRINRLGANGELISAIIKKQGFLPDVPCRTDDVGNREDFIGVLVNHAGKNFDNFIAAVDALERTKDQKQGKTLLKHLRNNLPPMQESFLTVECLLALANAFIVHEQHVVAEEIVEQCMQISRPNFSPDVLQTLYASNMIDIGVRLLKAAARFPHLWSRSVECAYQYRDLVDGVLTQKKHLVDMLCGFLQITPLIISVDQRIAWLSQTLLEIRNAVIQESAQGKSFAADFHFQISAVFKRISPEEALAEQFEEALFAVVPDLPNILEAEDQLDPVLDLLQTIATVQTTTGRDKEHTLSFFRKLTPTLAVSTNLHIVVVAVEHFLDSINEFNLVSNEAVDILEEVLKALSTHTDRGFAVSAFRSVFDKVEKLWFKGKKKYRALYASILLSVIESNECKDIMESYNAEFQEWITYASPDNRLGMEIRWAVQLIKFGREIEGKTLLSSLYSASQKNEKYFSAQVRRLFARAFANIGEIEMVEQLLLADLTTRLMPIDMDVLKQGLASASILIHSNEHPVAHAYLQAVAVQYREQTWPDLQGEDTVEEIILNGFYNLDNEILIQELISLSQDELLRSTNEDAILAAEWYVMLALSSISEIKATQEIWQNLNEWKPKIQNSVIRNAILDILLTALSNNGDISGKLEQLGQLINRINHLDTLSNALQESVCLIEPGIVSQAPDVVNMILGYARRLSESSHIRDFVEAYCEKLAYLEPQVVEEAVQLLMRTLQEWDSSDKELQIFSSKDVMKPIVDLLFHRRSDQSLPTIKNILVLAGAEIVQYAFETGTKYVPHSEITDWIKFGVETSQRVKEKETRYSLLFEIIRNTLGIFPIDSHPIIETLIARLHKTSTDHTKKKVDWTELYSILSKHPNFISDSLPPTQSLGNLNLRDKNENKLRSILEKEILDGGPPEQLGNITKWVGNLYSTPLRNLAEKEEEKILKNMDAFCQQTNLLWEWGNYIEKTIGLWEADQIQERMFKLTNWIEHMPKVNNEDLRVTAFSILLRASARIKNPERSSIQIHILHRAFSVVGMLQIDFFEFGIDATILDAVLDLSLKEDFINKDPSNAARMQLAITNDDHVKPVPSKLSKLINLIIDNLSHDEGLESTSVFNAFSRRLQCYERESLDLDWPKLADCVSRCPHLSLRQELGKILLDHYRQESFNDLTIEEIRYLAMMPTEWWIEKITEVSTERISSKQYIELLESCGRERPELITFLIILISGWMSDKNPDELHDFWFGIVSKSLPLSSSIRFLVAEQIIY